jgi:hypothetical protein
MCADPLPMVRAMTIMYGPYEPPPPTQPPPPDLYYGAGQFPPDGIPPAAPVPIPASQPSLLGALLCVVGLGLGLIGLFALPIQRYGSADDPSYVRDVGFVQVHDLVGTTDLIVGNDPDLASPLARFWWLVGLMLAAGALVLLIGVICVARAPRIVRPIGSVTALLALVAIGCEALALHQTADYRSAMFEDPASGSMYHDSGLGPWLGFAGLAAIVIGGAITTVLARRTHA